MNFGDRNLVGVAGRELRALKKTTSVAVYTLKFLRISGPANWNQVFLKDTYYEGLQKIIKS